VASRGDSGSNHEHEHGANRERLIREETRGLALVRCFHDGSSHYSDFDIGEPGIFVERIGFPQ